MESIRSASRDVVVIFGWPLSNHGAPSLAAATCRAKQNDAAKAVRVLGNVDCCVA